ncbi:hypothetical protein SAMN06295967_105157 [Belliella buryatensis]|uniref:LemA protein n=1 Tax=Belliella buryatensis TaxID=1500549 RepID=A0A239CP64_9BACT|nr:hypothetical protein [Belliella buryatensis]SNS21927.1 hypothetical protein SAMN06295967_105157 [Belliella buryatensis]
MGFIPIFLTLGGATMLFMMVVRQSFVNKKQQFDSLLESVVVGLSKISGKPACNADLASIQASIQEVKTKLNTANLTEYDTFVKSPLNQAKLIRLQHNQLITKKPYSFVAKIFGYKAI